MQEAGGMKVLSRPLMSPSLSGFRAGLEVMRVRIRGALGDIDPLNKVPLIRVKKGPLPGVSLILPRLVSCAGTRRFWMFRIWDTPKLIKTLGGRGEGGTLGVEDYTSLNRPYKVLIMCMRAPYPPVCLPP